MNEKKLVKIVRSPKYLTFSEKGEFNLRIQHVLQNASDFTCGFNISLVRIDIHMFTRFVGPVQGKG